MAKSLLPDDVIYHIIFPFLVNQDICNTSDFQIFRVNKRVHSTKPPCFSIPKIKFGNQVWCSVHTPHEYTFSKYIKDHTDSIQTHKMINNFFSSDNNGWTIGIRHLLNDDSLTYHNYEHTYTPNDLLYYWKRVLDNSSYEVEHLCCGGQGVVLLRRNVSKIE